MLPYQIEFINLARQHDVLKFGEFTLKSGRISPYFFNAGAFACGEALAALGRCYARRIVDSGVQFDILLGPAYKGKTLPATDPAEAAIPDPTAEQLENLLAEAKTDEAMLHLKVFLDRRKPRSYALANALVVLRNRRNLLRQRELRGTIDSRDASVENNQIVEQLLALIAQAQTL